MEGAWLNLYFFLFSFSFSFSYFFYFKVREAVSLIDVRRRFIEALAHLIGRPVEADSVCI